MIKIGKVIKKNLDINNHVNISEYIRLADNSNYKLFDKIKLKKSIYLVAKKTFVESRSELTLNDKWQIESFIIKLDDMFVVSRHEISNLKKKKIASICYFLLIPLSKKNRKIIKFSKFEMTKIKKKIKKNYFNPFK